MDLNALGARLREQAAGGAIRLDHSVFPPEVVEAVRVAFALPAGDVLTLHNVHEADMGEPHDGVLVVAGATTSVLNQDGVGAQIMFVANGTSYDALIVVTMSPEWTFASSFPDLARFPFTVLDVSSVRFAYATRPWPGFAWGTEPDDAVTLSPGLNILTEVGLGAVSTLAAVLQQPVSPDPIRLFGPFSPVAGQQLPVGQIRAELTAAPFSVGVAPHTLTLDAPALVASVTAATPEWPHQQVGVAIEATFNEALRVSVFLPEAGDALEVSAEPLPGHGSIEDLIESLPGGAGFTSYVPGELDDVFAEIGLDTFTMLVGPGPSVTSLSLTLATTKPWPLIDNVLTLSEVKLHVSILDPGGLAWTEATIYATAPLFDDTFPGAFDFVVRLDKGERWTVGPVGGSYRGAATMAQFIHGLPGVTARVPAALEAVAFTRLSVSAVRAAPTDDFTLEFHADAEFTLPILGTELAGVCYVSAVTAPSGYAVRIAGGVGIGNEAFTFEVDLGTTGAVLAASWTHTGTPLTFREAAQTLGWRDLPEIPAGLDLALASAAFRYEFASESLALGATSADGGGVVFATELIDGARARLFRLHLPIEVALSDLPVVGEHLPAGLDAGLRGLDIGYASSALTPEQLDRINTNLTSAGIAPVAPGTLAAGLLLSTTLALGTETHGLGLPVGSSTSNEAAPHAAASSDVPQLAAATDPAGDAPTWIPVQRSFGPVRLNRAGLALQRDDGQDPRLALVLDGSVMIGGLTLSLQGLAVTVTLADPLPPPSLDLTGMGLAYASGPLSITGAFLKGEITYDGHPYPAYGGGAQLREGELALAAIGTYAQLPAGPTVFVYAWLDYPLGGPPFFQIEGLAAGFGYNRRLILPPVTGVAAFPLVKEATSGRTPGADLADELRLLADWLPPSIGDVLLVVGVHFSSFRMIDSFVLVVASFGHRFELDVLGLSTMTLPARDTAAANTTPIAEVQLALRASVVPDDGYLTVVAQLTPDSYVLSRACHLRGGIALSSWFDGPHDGDFALTAGGYHPHFPVPDHYPSVPRLGFSWQVSAQLSMRGSAYYALTPSAMMAGGALSAVWQDGSSRAWFDTSMDFLVSWQPYHYEAALQVSVGASYTYWFFGTRTVSVQVGTAVELWGPEFGGTATIDLHITSIRISFGADRSPAPDPVSWERFRNTLLPPRDAVTSIVLRGDSHRAADAAEDDLGVVDPAGLVLTTSSAIPATAAVRGTGARQHDLPTGPANIRFGVAPVGVTPGGVAARHQITITRDGVGAEDQFDYAPVLKNLPAALWGGRRAPSASDAPLVPDLLAGYRITPRPFDTDIDQTWLEVTALQADTATFTLTDAITLHPPPAQPTLTAPDAERATLIGEGIRQPGVTAARAGVLAVVLPGAPVDLTDFDTDLFHAIPQVAADV